MLLAIPWWGWSVILLVFTFFLGIVAVIAGVGGGVLYVPIVTALFPFHIDYVRGAGLMVALTGALSAGPHLLRSGVASLRMALPFALVGSMGSVVGAAVGLAVSESFVKALMGATILGVVVLMIMSKQSEGPASLESDKLSDLLNIRGNYHDSTLGKTVTWRIRRTAPTIALYVVIGFLGGMFGLGAGWANVPALNLLLGAPLRMSVATSSLIVSINGTAAAWVYLNNGAVLPLIAVPSVIGMVLGTRIGARLLTWARPTSIKWVVILFLMIAGLRSLLDGLGIWN